MPLKVDVITPEKNALSKEVDSLVAPASDGEVGILPGHAPFLTKLGFGELRLRKGNSVEYFAVAGGFLEVKPGNQVSIFAEDADQADEIDVEREKLEAEKAEAQLKEAKTLTAEEYAKVEANLAKTIVKIKVGNLRGGQKKPPPGIH